MIRHRSLSASALAAAALALALGACGGTEGSDSAGAERAAAAPSPSSAAASASTLGGSGAGTSSLEHQLSAQLGRSTGVSPRGVRCPGGIAAEKGRTFSCTLTAPGGEPVRVDVTLTNDQGGFRAVVPPRRAALADEQRGADAHVP